MNLHLVEKKKSKNPGDDAQMVQNRRSFLNAGYYQPFADAIGNILFRLAPDTSHLIDMGCGEGYYLEQLLKYLSINKALTNPDTSHHGSNDSSHSLSAAGVDLSKHGIRLAAKRKTGVQLAVASTYDLPFFDNQFDAALSIFSPLSPMETLRVLKPGALLVMVGPGPAHLKELAAMIYKTPRAHKGNFDILRDNDRFARLASETLTTEVTVTGDALPDLLRMTPYYWQATPEQQRQLFELPMLNVKCQFEIQTYRISQHSPAPSH